MTAYAPPMNSAEYARQRNREAPQKAIVRPSAPRLADFPETLQAAGMKMAGWVEDENMRKVVALAYCAYWGKTFAAPRIAPPGGDEYNVLKLVLQVRLSPHIFPCGVCGWPRAEEYDCFCCGDVFDEEDPYQRSKVGQR